MSGTGDIVNCFLIFDHAPIAKNSAFILITRFSCEERSEDKRVDRLCQFHFPCRRDRGRLRLLSIETRLHKVTRQSAPPLLWDARKGARRTRLNWLCVSSRTFTFTPGSLAASPKGAVKISSCHAHIAPDCVGCCRQRDCGVHAKEAAVAGQTTTVTGGEKCVRDGFGVRRQCQTDGTHAAMTGSGPVGQGS